MSDYKWRPEEIDPRRAGRVRRWHTWPTVAGQDVQGHCWQLARVLLAIWPEAPREVVVHALMHDVGEAGPGDMPYPFKRSSPEMKRLFNELEHSCHLAMCLPWGVPAPITLSDEHQRIFKLAEFIEMWEASLDEVTAGNAAFWRVIETCWRQMVELSKNVPREVCSRYLDYTTRRRKMFNNTLHSEGGPF